MNDMEKQTMIQGHRAWNKHRLASGWYLMMLAQEMKGRNFSGSCSTVNLLTPESQCLLVWKGEQQIEDIFLPPPCGHYPFYHHLKSEAFLYYPG
ncbi:Hyaluronidase-3 [Manis pentadactyla]|nr:Hyaluronidase-3 [Manis pentadactyla]